MYTHTHIHSHRGGEGKKSLNLFLPLLTEFQRSPRSRTPTCWSVIMFIICRCYYAAGFFSFFCFFFSKPAAASELAGCTPPKRRFAALLLWWRSEAAHGGPDLSVSGELRDWLMSSWPRRLFGRLGKWWCQPLSVHVAAAVFFFFLFWGSAASAFFFLLCD